MSDTAVKGRWRDLSVRLASALVLLGIAGVAVAMGPAVFGLLVFAIAGVMQWELSRMCAPRAAWVPWASGAGAVLVLLPFYGPVSGLWRLEFAEIAALGALAFCAAMIGLHSQRRLVAAAYSLALLITGAALAIEFAVVPHFVILLLLVVILTDVAGYFAGKAIGGRKFWPAISPKKTWAGIIAGWVAALLGALLLDLWMQIPDWAIVAAPFMAFASQLGDIGESAIKRAAGVKDSSALIPGHGGFLDRFDGVVGATVVLAFVSVFMLAW